MRNMSSKYLAIGIVFTILTSCNDAKKNYEASDRKGLEEVTKKGSQDLTQGNSIIGKVLCGYQGWFNAMEDGADLDWKHYEIDGKFEHQAS
jgi:hypothetical protein